MYEVRVSVPEDYDNDQELRPVIYALDGQWNFTLLSDIVGKLAFDGSIPDPIVVGITWADAGFQPAAERARDFTPVARADLPGSGGAAKFLQVLETEIFPLVQSNYRASTERVLTGGSLGGLFVSYALLERPDLFTAYIASSGATGLGQEYFTRRLAEISPELLRNERAYFSVGELYDVTETVRGFVHSLEAVVGKSPRIVLDVVPGVGHTGNESFGYIRGLLHAFQRPHLSLSKRFLERYEGVYFDPSDPELPDLTIEAGRGELYIVQEGQRWIEAFYAATPTHFYVEGEDLDLTFHRNDDGTLSLTLSYQRTPYELVRR
jgi:pimeloyl-ACP methyl ester carboxylesterase